ncbi:MAG: SDR family oxidoreductase [Cyanobacteria bacterium]|nr:SDR family oxidoreductase [Cyanobacteriota bacterium]
MILVTGATGYVGGRLIPRLLALGFQVRAVARSRAKILSRPWADHPNLDVQEMDVFNPESVRTALAGCQSAYYLIHSMSVEHADFSAADRKAAQIFVDAANQNDLSQLIYLGGLGEHGPDLSKHLTSRAEVAAILQKAQCDVTVLRAAMIIGSGSASFEILRYLVERLPVMITPKWVFTPTQPIAIRNVLGYLIGCLTTPEVRGRVLDIGGADRLTYLDLMRTYAEEAGLAKRWFIPVPFFTPSLSAYWIHFVTPVGAAIARPLAEGLKNSTLCQNDEITRWIPQDLLSCREAIRLALQRHKDRQVETHWSDAGELPSPETIYPGDPTWSGGTVYLDRRSIVVEGSKGALWAKIIRIGGETGWYYGNFLWHLRGLLDLLFGGVGLRRGRRDPEWLKPGDALDFWRVIDCLTEQRLFLKAEMRLPGEAYLEFELSQIPENPAAVKLTQTARFAPRGLMGMLYWFAVTPLHHVVFNGMLRGVAKASGLKILQPPQQEK